MKKRIYLTYLILFFAGRIDAQSVFPFGNPEWIEKGEGSYGDPYIAFPEKGTKVRVGKYSSIAVEVCIFLGGNHRTDWVTTYPFPNIWPEVAYLKDSVTTKGDVIIGSDVWIGAGAVILSGVTIGDGAIIGASSVVAKNIPPYAVAVGNPARVVKYRYNEDTVGKLLKIKWWDWPKDQIMSIMPILCSKNIDEFLNFCTTRGLLEE